MSPTKQATAAAEVMKTLAISQPEAIAPAKIEPDEMYSVAQIAAYMKVSDDTADRVLKRTKTPIYKFGCKRVMGRDFLKMLEAVKVQG